MKTFAFCLVCLLVIMQRCHGEQQDDADLLPIEVNEFPPPQRPDVRLLSEPNQGQYSDFLKYLYRFDKNKVQ